MIAFIALGVEPLSVMLLTHNVQPIFLWTPRMISRLEKAFYQYFFDLALEKYFETEDNLIYTKGKSGIESF